MAGCKRLVVIGGNGAMLGPAALHLSKPSAPARVVASHTRPRALAQRVANWREHGALITKTIEETMAQEADAVVMCVGKNADDLPLIAKCCRLWSGTGRALLHLSTVSPLFARVASKFCQTHGLRYGNYPLTGGPLGAQKGTMLILASGDRALYDEFEPTLKALGRPRYFGEEVGRGSEVKLQGHMMVFGGLLGISSAAATSFACAGGSVSQSADVADLMAYLNTGSGGTNQWPLCLSRGVEEDDWAEGFQASHAAIDALYAADMARGYRLSCMTQGLLTLTAASLGFVVLKVGSQRIATHALAKDLCDAGGLDSHLAPIWAKLGDPSAALETARSLLPPALQAKVLLHVTEADFQNAME